MGRILMAWCYYRRFMRKTKENSNQKYLVQWNGSWKQDPCKFITQLTSSEQEESWMWHLLITFISRVELSPKEKYVCWYVVFTVKGWFSRSCGLGDWVDSQQIVLLFNRGEIMTVACDLFKQKEGIFASLFWEFHWFPLGLSTDFS